MSAQLKTHNRHWRDRCAGSDGAPADVRQHAKQARAAEGLCPVCGMWVIAWKHKGTLRLHRPPTSLKRPEESLR